MVVISVGAVISIGAGEAVGYDIRVIYSTTGEIIRALTIDHEHRYHGTGRPTGGPKGPRKTNRTGP